MILITIVISATFFFFALGAAYDTGIKHGKALTKPAIIAKHDYQYSNELRENLKYLQSRLEKAEWPEERQRLNKMMSVMEDALVVNSIKVETI
jgi:hypothetical protein